MRFMDGFRYYTWLSEVLIVQAAMLAGVFALVVVKNYKFKTVKRHYGQS